MPSPIEASLNCVYSRLYTNCKPKNSVIIDSPTVHWLDIPSAKPFVNWQLRTAYTCPPSMNIVLPLTQGGRWDDWQGSMSSLHMFRYGCSVKSMSK
ncbi:hypothetical protein K443DRAFT_152368 [Laccaria amethystina LaAM-08-1]|uniref:Uncharacterized protein n=1 Tax=Laccaria amethystina LaAM-08-1 TaxID=1095629 RepID=A0A0C9YID9_9AGAR|nr:hypothetical protein K443DRAFT_152368 [Laccaria amethystina LaAM-08-1]